jgi:hypothetical protein
VNRGDFQQLAELRLREAEALVAAGLWDGAYYLAGYAVECGLKACILARVEREGVLFDAGNRDFSKNCWTHDLDKLLDLAGLTGVRRADGGADRAFEENWQTVVAWDEESRYVLGRTESAARNYLAALTDPNHGVRIWITRHW